MNTSAEAALRSRTEFDCKQDGRGFDSHSMKLTIFILLVLATTKTKRQSAANSVMQCRESWAKRGEIVRRGVS